VGARRAAKPGTYHKAGGLSLLKSQGSPGLARISWQMPGFPGGFPQGVRIAWRGFRRNLRIGPFVIAMIVCACIGLFNGFVVAILKVPPFIATLGTWLAVYGLNSMYFDRPPYGAQPIGGLDTRFTNLGSGFIGKDSVYSIPYIVLIALVASIFVWVLYNKTVFGKNLYAIGGNPVAAKVSGVNVTKNLIGIYAFAGLLYGLAGCLEAARTGGATNNYGNMYELDAIAACVVGGVSTAGGIGTVPGMLIGVLIFSVINYGLTFIGMSPYLQLVVKGAIILAAVAIDIRKYLTKK